MPLSLTPVPEIFTMFPLEKLIAMLKGNVAVFEQIWLPVLEHRATKIQDIMFKAKYTF